MKSIIIVSMIVAMFIAAFELMVFGNLFSFEIRKDGQAWYSTNGVNWIFWEDEDGYWPTNQIVGFCEDSNGMFLLAGTNVTFTITEMVTNTGSTLLRFSSNSWMYMGPSVNNPIGDTNPPPLPP